MENKPTQDGTFKKLYHIDNLPQDAVWRDKIGLCTRSLGQAAGSRNLYVNIDSVPPGAYSTRFHSHSQQEEFFLVLSGNGTVRLNDKSYPVTKGDFFAKPSGQNIAHSIYNFGDTDLILLDIGTVEQEDTCYYPDEDMYLLKSNGQRRIISGSDFNNEWTTEPNADEAGDTL